MKRNFHIQIKKDYAIALIELLQQEGAIEILVNDDADILEWQQEAVIKTLANVNQNPEALQPWDIIKEKFRHSRNEQ